MRYYPVKLLLVANLAWLCAWSLLAWPAACETVMLPMPDGTRLATDIYVPDGQGPFPVVLVRTTYNKNSLDGIAKDFKQHKGHGFCTE